MSQRGILLVNLGSPDSPSVPDVRRYLREFLMDGRVIDTPWPLRALVVYGFILPSRPKQSAEAYHSIWTAEGSPLVIYGKKLQSEIESRTGLPTGLAMRYQNPSIPDALRALCDRNVDDLLLLPLFPHYAMSSYETAVVRVLEVARSQSPNCRVRVVAPYFDDPDYIEALAASAQPHLQEPFDHLLFSFHGVPERHLRKSDPTGQHCLSRPDCCQGEHPAHKTCYRAQCFRTVEALVQRLGLTPDRYSTAFQSRLGRDPWLKPYTDHELERLAKAGCRRLRVICPAFVADCLETIEEIGMRGRETFLHAGGQDCHLIPCLNDNPAWLSALEKMIARQWKA